MSKLRYILPLNVLVLIFSVVCSGSSQGHAFFEKDYQNIWCRERSGITEFILPDRARVDCVTQTHAIEFDFAKKWAESIGQSLYYAHVLNKNPGIVLIVEDKIKDQKYIDRVQSVAIKQGIKIWLMYPEDIPKIH